MRLKSLKTKWMDRLQPTFFRILVGLLGGLLTLLPPIASLAYQDGDYLDFQGIVSELSQETTAQTPLTQPPSDWEVIRLHLGAGYTTSLIDLKGQGLPRVSGLLPGFEINTGIDLFHTDWLAEGTLRFFQETDFDKNQVDLTEFDLKILYRPIIATQLRTRVGFGVAARYLDFSGSTPIEQTDVTPSTTSLTPTAQAEAFETQFATAALLSELGLELMLAPALSVGGRVAYTSPFVSDTVEQGSWDASFRLDAHF